MKRASKREILPWAFPFYLMGLAGLLDSRRAELGEWYEAYGLQTIMALFVISFFALVISNLFELKKPLPSRNWDPADGPPPNDLTQN